MLHRVLFTLLSTFILFFSTGCILVGPDFETPESDVPETWRAAGDARVTATAEEHALWWESFNDPTLTALVEKAYANNHTLQIAGLRVYEARAILGRVKGLLYPQRQRVTGGASHIELSDNADPISTLPDAVGDLTDTSFQNYGLGLDAFWELDFWGRFRRGIEGAEANLEGSLANYDDALVTLTGEVATAYIALRVLEERLVIANKNVGIQKRGVEIAGVRFRNGMTTELDVQQAKALLHNTQSLIPLLESQIVKAKNALSLLLGETPGEIDALLAENQSIPTGPTALAVNVPGELLRRRPDVRRAEMMAAGQSAAIGVAQADFYPALRLVGSVGLVADSTGDVFDSDSFSSIGGFGLMWKFLNYGRIRNKVRTQDARFQQLVTAYQLTVLNAAREVDDSLTGFVKSQDEAEEKGKSAKAAERAVELALTLYKDGSTDYTTVLDTQRVQLLQQDLHTAARGKVALQLVAAYKALGGGWQLRTNEEFVSQETRDEMSERTNWGELLD